MERPCSKRDCPNKPTLVPEGFPKEFVCEMHRCDQDFDHPDPTQRTTISTGSLIEAPRAISVPTLMGEFDTWSFDVNEIYECYEQTVLDDLEITMKGYAAQMGRSRRPGHDYPYDEGYHRDIVKRFMQEFMGIVTEFTTLSVWLNDGCAKMEIQELLRRIKEPTRYITLNTKCNIELRRQKIRTLPARLAVYLKSKQVCLAPC